MIVRFAFSLTSSEGIPLEQGLRRTIAVAIVPRFNTSEGIPLEQGLRRDNHHIKSCFHMSEGIPLEQGLRH